MSADGRLSLHVLERLQPRAPLPGEREAPLTGVHNGPHGADMLFRRLRGHCPGLRFQQFATWPCGSDVPMHGRWRGVATGKRRGRSEEHTSELQSLMRNSYAVFCWKKKRRL